MEPVEKIYRPQRKMLLNNFLGGIAWGMGTIIGASIIVTIFGFIINQINLLPIIGTWIIEIINFINDYKTNGL